MVPTAGDTWMDVLVPWYSIISLRLHYFIIPSSLPYCHYCPCVINKGHVTLTHRHNVWSRLFLFLFASSFPLLFFSVFFSRFWLPFPPSSIFLLLLRSSHLRLDSNSLFSTPSFNGRIRFFDRISPSLFSPPPFSLHTPFIFIFFQPDPAVLFHLSLSRLILTY